MAISSPANEFRRATAEIVTTNEMMDLIHDKESKGCSSAGGNAA
jgi:hypothetical protein